MKEGERVMIYEDPLTELNPEGEAILMAKVRENLWLDWERWIVKFISDGFITDRRILKKELVSSMFEKEETVGAP